MARGPTAGATQVIGLCGGIASGKSTAAAWLQAWGAAHLDVDALGHRQLMAGSAALPAIVARFGAEVVGMDGHVVRAKLGAKVFGDAAALADLNAIVHPPMRAAAEAWLAEQRRQQLPWAIIDAALLYEMQLADRCDAVIAVVAPPAVQVARLMASRALTAEQAQARLRAQLPQDAYAIRGAEVIDNAGTLGEFAARLAEWWRQLHARRGLASPALAALLAATVA